MAMTSTAAAILQDIYERRGVLTPDHVVEEASDPAHPLHGSFEWDDAKAGHEYRLVQAQQIIRSVKVAVVPAGDARPVRVRAWVSQRDLVVADDEGVLGAGAYVSLHDVAASPASASAYERSLKREWENLRRKAEGVSWFLSWVADDINGVQQKSA